ncbi:MAG: hypothetical protein AAF515_03110 [Pseudomonadota bacterium]
MLFDAVLAGVLLSVWLCAMILLSFRHSPRLWLHHFPREMQALVPPKTAAENRSSLLWALPTTGSMILVPLLAALAGNGEHNFGYLQAFCFIWVCLQMFNLIDLVILDWLVFVWWHPSFMQLDGASSALQHNTYWFHFVGFAKGLLIGTVAAAVLALPFLWL